MTVNREVIAAEDRRLVGRDVAVAQQRDEVSRVTVFWYSAVGIILLSWFLFGWLVQEQGFIDSVGESLGTGFALLLVISIIGMVRRSRRP